MLSQRHRTVLAAAVAVAVGVGTALLAWAQGTPKFEVFAPETAERLELVGMGGIMISVQGSAPGYRCRSAQHYVTATWHVPTDWDASSDVSFDVTWLPQAGDPVADAETVVWDLYARSRTEGETASGGTEYNADATHTQSGAGAELEYYVTTITYDRDNADQPLTEGDIVTVVFKNDDGGTYSGDPFIVEIDVRYNQDQ